MKDNEIVTAEKNLLPRFINLLWEEIELPDFDLERWAVRCCKVLNKYLVDKGHALPVFDRTWQHYMTIIRPPTEWIRHDIAVDPKRLKEFMAQYGLKDTRIVL